MNPEHAKAFNELRELCRKYGMRIKGLPNADLEFCFYDSEDTYERSEFFKEVNYIIHKGIVPIPTPRNKR